jgi:hypothetical protein
MKKIGFLLLFVAQAIVVSAQDEFDALRYSFTSYQGTARGLAIGNAMGSLGADFSSLSINPAGLGLYRRGEISFSPSFTINNTKGNYLGQQQKNNDSKFNLAHIGVVFTNAKKGNAYKRSGWKAASFAFGLNRQATFQNQYSYTGRNFSSSIVENFAEQFNRLGGLNNNTLNSVSYPAYAAWATYLIDQDFAGDTNNAKSYVPYTDGIQQTKRVIETGGMHEYVISAGGNYMEKLMLGATMGITRSNYSRNTQFDEVDLSGNTSNDFKYLRYNENLTTEGTGVNLKLGAIFKPSDVFRFGIAFHTPTRIYFNDTYNISMQSHTDSLKIRNNPGADPITTFNQDTTQIFNYSLNTPYKALASATILFKQYGFITADIEYVDYKSMKYNYGIGYEIESSNMNNVIQNTYTDAVNIRIGAEAKLDDFAIRGGFAMYGSPYANNSSAARTNISGGVGYRTKDWYIDATCIYSQHKWNEMPYVLSRAGANVQAASIQNNTTQVLFTLGRRF